MCTFPPVLYIGAVEALPVPGFGSVVNGTWHVSTGHGKGRAHATGIADLELSRDGEIDTAADSKIGGPLVVVTADLRM